MVNLLKIFYQCISPRTYKVLFKCLLKYRRNSNGVICNLVLFRITKHLSFISLNVFSVQIRPMIIATFIVLSTLALPNTSNTIKRTQKHNFP